MAALSCHLCVCPHACTPQPEAAIEKVDRGSEVAPHVQDDFDIQASWGCRFTAAVSAPVHRAPQPCRAAHSSLTAHPAVTSYHILPAFPHTHTHTPPLQCWRLQEEGMAEISLADRPEVQEKLRRRIESAKVKVGHGTPCRPQTCPPSAGC